MGRSITAGDGSGLAKSLISNETRASPFLLIFVPRNSGHQYTECAWCSRPSAGMGAEPRPHRSGRGRLCLCPRVRYAALWTNAPAHLLLPPPSLKKRSEALKTAFTRLFGMKRRVPPRRRREGAALQGSGGATPCQGAASRRRAGRPGEAEARSAPLPLLPPAGV